MKQLPRQPSSAHRVSLLTCTALLFTLFSLSASAGSYGRGAFTVDLPVYADGSTRIDLDQLARDHGINSRHYRIRKAVVFANSWGYGSWTSLRIGKRQTPEYHFASSYDEQHFDGFEAVRIPVHQRHSRHWSLLVGPYTSVRNVVLHLVPANHAYTRSHVSSLYLAPRLYWYDSTWHRAPRYLARHHAGRAYDRGYRQGLRSGLRHGYRGYFHHNPQRRHGHKPRKHRREHHASFGYRDGYKDGRRHERRVERRADRREEQLRAERRERRVETRQDQRKAERRAERRADQRRAERRADRRDDQRRAERRAERHAGTNREQRGSNREHRAGFGRDQRAERRERRTERPERRAERPERRAERPERRAERRDNRTADSGNQSRPKHWRGNKPQDGLRREQWSRQRN